MHELGVVFHVIKKVEEVAKEQKYADIVNDAIERIEVMDK